MGAEQRSWKGEGHAFLYRHAADDHEAIQQAQTIAEDVLDEPLPEEVRTPLWSLMPALFGNVELAQKRSFGK